MTTDVTTVAAAPRALGTWLDPFLLAGPAAAFILFAVTNQNFGFDPPGWLDPFMYLGYFWHYAEHVPALENYYKASRLPWVLPGFIAHQLFDVTTAAYVLNWLTLSGSGMAMYLLVRDALGDKTAAAVMSVAWVAATPAHGSGGWNYHVGAAVAYHLGASWAAMRAASSPAHGRMAALAGALLACAIHTHLFLATFMPLVLALYLAGAPRGVGWPRRVALDSGRAIAGGIAITALLALVNAATGGRWLFFMPQIDYTRWLAALPLNPWWYETHIWVPNARHLVLPLVGIGAGTLALIRARARSRTRHVFVLNAWAALAIAAYYQFVERQSVLDHDYMAFVLYGHAFPALAVAVPSSQSARTTSWWAAAVTGVAGALIMTALFGVPAAIDPWRWVSALLPDMPLLAAGCLAGLATFALVMLVPGRLAIVAFAGWFALVNLWVSPANGPYTAGGAGVNRSMLELFREIDGVTWRLDPSLIRLKYWFGIEIATTPHGPVNLAAMFDSYTSTRGWAGTILGTGSPGPPIGEIGIEHLNGVSCIAALSSVAAQESTALMLRERFATIGRPLRVIGSYQFERPDLALGLTVLRVPGTDGDDAVADGHKACE